MYFHNYGKSLLSGVKLKQFFSLVSSLNSVKARTFKGGSVLVFLEQNIKIKKKSISCLSLELTTIFFSFNFVSHFKL